jgi:hypothetical protein
MRRKLGGIGRAGQVPDGSFRPGLRPSRNRRHKKNGAPPSEGGAPQNPAG